MEDCREVERELTAYEGGELNPTDRDRVRGHLNLCAECRAELAREKMLRKTLGTLPQAAAPSDLDHRITAAVGPGQEPVRVRRHRHRLAVALTAAAAGLALVIFLPNFFSPPGPESVTQADRPAWSDQEIAAARDEVLFSLALTARVLDRTRKAAVVEVFANQLPQAVNESLKSVKPNTPGGNG